MLNPSPNDYCNLGANENARLIVVIDTEEEYDWSREVSRENTSVQSMRYITRAQDIFDQYRIKPTYVVDYPIVSQPEGYKPLQEIHASGNCLIGTHLHPWVNPPFDEPVNRRNSFPGNLSPILEITKLKILTEYIGERFGQRPTIYKAGRYGIGSQTAEILEEQGYEVDLSICPHMDYSQEAGPDFTNYTAWPYWFGRRRLLELPLTAGFDGLLRCWGAKLHRTANREPLASLHGPGILARLGLVNKIRLSPEGFLPKELIALVRALYADGLRIFSFAFHSPSLEWGNTPYVKDEPGLESFFSCCRRFFDFFLGDLGGVSTTPLELRVKLAQSNNTVRE